ncbi:MAG: LptA/OstA family protein [Aestuariivirga sp.]
MGFAKTATLLALGVAIALPTSHHAAQAAGAVDISADNMEIIDAEHKTIFRGNVVATRVTDTTKSDEMTVTSGDEKQADGSVKNVTKTVDCQGNVNITTKSAVISGDWCKLDVLHDKLMVGGTVSLVQGATVIKGKQLDVDLKTNHLQMSGGRVSGNFVPN